MHPTGYFICTVYNAEPLSFNHSFCIWTGWWMAITTAQTGKLDQSFMPTVNIITAGKHSSAQYSMCEWWMCLKLNLFVFFHFSQIEGEEELRRFEEGKARYLQNKAKRLADKERQQWCCRSPESNACTNSINPTQHIYSMKNCIVIVASW